MRLRKRKNSGFDRTVNNLLQIVVDFNSRRFDELIDKFCCLFLPLSLFNFACFIELFGGFCRLLRPPNHLVNNSDYGNFGEELLQGIDHMIRQSGKNLSGGQKQRLSIARALLKNAPIYIFDDSFSALDFLTEAKLRAALNRNLAGKTQLIITQRVTSAMHCDVIFVMDGGALVDSGTHAQLLERCGVYREIYASQTGGNLNA